jgi:hypothetical protein
VGRVRQHARAAGGALFFHVAGGLDDSNEVMAQVWGERLGRDYYHFVYHDVLFLVLNTEHVPIQLPSEAEKLLAEIYALRETDPEKAASLTHIHDPEREA